jgi:Tol biopolymer transport system component
MRRKAILKPLKMSKSWVTICALILLPLLVPCEIFAEGETTRVSVSSTGVQGNNLSLDKSISSDGRFVAFNSEADNLVVGDSNGFSDIFVHDRQTAQTTRVSVSSTGVQGNGVVGLLSISSDGRYVAFGSEADNLVVGDSNGSSDIFVHDRLTGQTERVSVSSTGVQGNWYSVNTPPISSNGRYVAFASGANNLVDGDNNNFYDIFVHDRLTGQTTRVSESSTGTQGNGNCASPSMSSDGRYVTFVSWADNLVVGDSNNYRDAFVHDRQTGQTTRVSVSSTGVQGNGNCTNPTPISSNGRYVAFTSEADNLVVGDSNGFWDIFVHDRQTESVRRTLPSLPLLLIED